MTGGTKIFLAVFGLLLLLLIVYYGFLGGAGPDEASAGRAANDPLAATTESDDADGAESNQSTLAQHEDTPTFGSANPTTNPSPTFGGTTTNPFGLAPASESGVTMGNPLFRSEADAAPGNEAVRDPLLPTPQPVEDPLNGINGATDDRPLVQPHQPQRSQTNAPTATTPRSNAAETVRHTLYTVQPNDTLSGIALDWFKDASKWDLIVEANPGINPDFIRQGSTLRLPPKSAARAAATAPRAGGTTSTPARGPRSHVVRSGDTLSFIAEQYYGRQNRWRDIYNANRAVIGSDPDVLHAGDRLVIPE